MYSSTICNHLRISLQGFGIGVKEGGGVDVTRGILRVFFCRNISFLEKIGKIIENQQLEVLVIGRMRIEMNSPTNSPVDFWS